MAEFGCEADVFIPKVEKIEDGNIELQDFSSRSSATLSTVQFLEPLDSVKPSKSIKKQQKADKKEAKKAGKPDKAQKTGETESKEEEELFVHELLNPPTWDESPEEYKTRLTKLIAALKKRCLVLEQHRFYQLFVASSGFTDVPQDPTVAGPSKPPHIDDVLPALDELCELIVLKTQELKEYQEAAAKEAKIKAKNKKAKLTKQRCFCCDCVRLGRITPEMAEKLKKAEEEAQKLSKPAKKFWFWKK